MSTTYTNSPVIPAISAGALEPYTAVSVGADGKVRKCSATERPFGYIVENGGCTAANEPVSVRLHGSPGTAKVKQDAAIAVGDVVLASDDGAVSDAAGLSGTGDTVYAVGYKIGPNEGAAGDIIEVTTNLHHGVDIA